MIQKTDIENAARLSFMYSKDVAETIAALAALTANPETANAETIARADKLIAKAQADLRKLRADIAPIIK